MIVDQLKRPRFVLAEIGGRLSDDGHIEWGAECAKHRLGHRDWGQVSHEATQFTLRPRLTSHQRLSPCRREMLEFAANSYDRQLMPLDECVCGLMEALTVHLRCLVKSVNEDDDGTSQM